MRPETENAHWLRLWRETQERIAKAEAAASDPAPKVDVRVVPPPA